MDGHTRKQAQSECKTKSFNKSIIFKSTMKVQKEINSSCGVRISFTEKGMEKSLAGREERDGSLGEAFPHVVGRSWNSLSCECFLYTELNHGGPLQHAKQAGLHC